MDAPNGAVRDGFSDAPRSYTFRAPCSLFLTSYPNFSLSSQLERSFYPSCL
jgi:hypothetical protein